MALLSADQLGKELGVSGSHIRRLAASGKIPCERYGDCWRFDLEKVRAASIHVSTIEKRVQETVMQWRMRRGLRLANKRSLP